MSLINRGVDNTKRQRKAAQAATNIDKAIDLLREAELILQGIEKPPSGLSDVPNIWMKVQEYRHLLERFAAPRARLLVSGGREE